jgi:hypothetical protein
MLLFLSVLKRLRGEKKERGTSPGNKTLVRKAATFIPSSQNVHDRQIRTFGRGESARCFPFRSLCNLSLALLQWGSDSIAKVRRVNRLHSHWTWRCTAELLCPLLRSTVSFLLLYQSLNHVRFESVTATWWTAQDREWGLTRGERRFPQKQGWK